jgi:hypothetical protein
MDDLGDRSSLVTIGSLLRRYGPAPGVLFCARIGADVQLHEYEAEGVRLTKLLYLGSVQGSRGGRC